MAGDSNHAANRSSDSESAYGTSKRSSRRRFLAAASAAGLAGIAGCGGGGGDGTTTTTTTTTTTSGGGDGESEGEGEGDGDDGDDTTTATEMERVDVAWAETMWSPVTDKTQWNWWNTENRLGSVEGDIYENLATFDGIAREFIPVMAEGWSYKPDKEQFDVKLIDGVTWTNGDDLVADDIVTRWRLERFATATEKGLKNGKIVSNSGAWQYATGVEAVDDRTVRFNLDGKVNSQLLKNTVVNDTVAVNRNVYGQWIDKFENATKEVKPYNKVRQNFTSWKLEEPVGCGIWAIDEMATSKVTLTLRTDHPLAEKVNFTRKENYAAETNKEHWALFKAGTTNGLGAAAPETVIQSFPDTTVYVDKLIPNYFGSGLALNFDHHALGKRPVRQALTYAIDARAPAENAGKYLPITDNFSGIGGGPANVPSQILGDFADKLIDYDVTKGTGGKDWELATQKLNEAGFSKQKGTWVMDNGKEFKLPMKVVAAHSDMVREFQTIVGQLKEFGIKAQMETVEGATFWDQQGRGEIRVGEAFWVNTFPVNNFDYYWAHESAKHGSYAWPQVVEDVPEIGGDGTENINCRNLVNNLYKEPDPERQREMYQRLAWAFNHDIPLIPIEERLLGYIYNPGDEFIVPTLDDANGALEGKPTGKQALGKQFDQGGMIRRGLIAAKQKQ